MARRLGATEEQLQNLAGFESYPGFSDAEKMALRLAEAVTRDSHSISDEFFARLREHFDEGEIIELLAAIGLFNYFNRFNNALEMEPTARS